MKSAVKNSTDNVKLGNTLKNILGNNPNIQASQKNAALYNQLLKASDLGGFENDSYKMLKEFSEGYVPEEKLQRIIGSVKYETGEAFKKYGKPEGVTGFNNGKRSVIDLRYSIDSIKETVNHENVHQISHGGMQKTKDGYNAIKAGIQYTLVDPSSGKVLQCSGKGANECITELFNQLTMGKKTSSSWYNEGTGKLRDLMDTGIIDLSDIKKYYFSNDGAGLMKHLRNATTNLGIGDRSFDILDAFDKAIDNNVEVKTEGLKKLNSIIKSINMSVY